MKKKQEESDVAALVIHGVYQYVRLPKDFRFAGDRVQIERHRNGVILTPLTEEVVPKKRKTVRP